MKLLHLIPSLNPAYGGVVNAVLLSTQALNRAGHATEILVLDAQDAVWLENVGAELHTLGPARGTYGYSSRLVPWLRAHSLEYDAVIVNGLWQYIGFAAWLALKDSSTPYFAFTHGMLDPWFKYKYRLKHLKKWLYWPWAEYRVLRDAHLVLFTCKEERILARESFWLYSANEAIVPLGVEAPPANGEELAVRFKTRYPELHGKKLVLFMGRIDEIKGVDLLIDAFAQVAQEDEKLHLVVAGPDLLDRAAKLRSRAAALGIANRVTWPGMLHADMKWGAFFAAEVLCLPSHHENFGMVVAEALACGKPVLISNKVQIRTEIADDGAGFVDDDTTEATVRSLKKWLTLDAAERSAMSERARQCFNSRFHIQSATEHLVQTIEEHVR